MNRTLNILIVEDERLYSDLLEDMLEELGHHHLATLDNAEQVLAFVNAQRPDLILMDIQIKGALDGIELANALQEVGRLPVIFITSQVDDHTYARAKSTQPYAFLEKSSRKRQLQRAIDLVSTQIQAPPGTPPTTAFPDSLMVKTRQSLQRVRFADILFVHAEDHHCTLTTPDRKYVSRISLKELMAQLPPGKFFQTHRAYVVNLGAIESISAGQGTVTLTHGHSIPLGRSFKTALVDRTKKI